MYKIIIISFTGDILQAQTNLGINIFKLIQQVNKTLTVILKYCLSQWKLSNIQKQ